MAATAERRTEIPGYCPCGGPLERVAEHLYVCRTCRPFGSGTTQPRLWWGEPRTSLMGESCAAVYALLTAVDAERSTRAELEGARQRLQTALNEATREAEATDRAAIAQLADASRRWAAESERRQAAEARAEEAERERNHYRGLAAARLDEPSAYRAEIEGVCEQLAEAQDRAAAVAASLRVFVHAHDTGNAVPPHLVAQAKTALAAPAGGRLDAVREAARVLARFAKPTNWTEIVRTDTGDPVMAWTAPDQGHQPADEARTALDGLAPWAGEGT